MLQNLPKDCDIMPEIVRSLKLDENYRVALSRWLKIILTFLVLVMIGTIGPPGIYVGEVGACDTKYMNEISIGADKNSYRKRIQGFWKTYAYSNPSI
ncbi:13816_t:CDS:2 [Gigaspora rosea]|nr:13816_t:CDS:2 [Gigaspora rosea]